MINVNENMVTWSHTRALGAWLQGSRVRIMVEGAPFVEGPLPSACLDMCMSENGQSKVVKIR